MALKTGKGTDLFYPLDCSLLLIGMMGCGKSTLGSRFAKCCRMPFVDVDTEVEKAAGCSVSDLFSLYGEAEFRRGEERIMERLLNGPKSVIAAGGGSFCRNARGRFPNKKQYPFFWMPIWQRLFATRRDARTARC